MCLAAWAQVMLVAGRGGEGPVDALRWNSGGVHARHCSCWSSSFFRLYVALPLLKVLGSHRPRLFLALCGFFQNIPFCKRNGTESDPLVLTQMRSFVVVLESPKRSPTGRSPWGRR